MATHTDKLEFLARGQAVELARLDKVVASLTSQLQEARKKTAKKHPLIGVKLDRYFSTGVHRAIVRSYARDTGLFTIMYQDGTSEEITGQEVHDSLIKPLCLMDLVKEIEESGNKAQSFARVAKAVVCDRDTVARAIPELVCCDLDIQRSGDIKPCIWRYMGKTEMQKLYTAKRVLEKLMKI